MFLINPIFKFDSIQSVVQRHAFVSNDQEFAYGYDHKNNRVFASNLKTKVTVIIDNVDTHQPENVRHAWTILEKVLYFSVDENRLCNVDLITSQATFTYHPDNTVSITMRNISDTFKSKSQKNSVFSDWLALIENATLEFNLIIE